MGSKNIPASAVPEKTASSSPEKGVNRMDRRKGQPITAERRIGTLLGWGWTKSLDPGKSLREGRTPPS